MISIRDAKAGEFELLWKIDQQCFVEGIAYTKAELKFYMELPGAFTLVAEEEERGLGFLIALVEHGEGEIITIDVLQSARRKNVGSRLMREAESRLKDAGCRMSQLQVAVDNMPAIRFYKRLGYSVTGTIPRYYNNSLDALVLKKALAAA